MSFKILMKSACTIAILAMGTTAVMAEYPEKPITVIVPNKAGGGSDLLARLFADKLAAELGQPIIIKNLEGAGTAIGSRAAHSAPADGYTILLHHEALLTLAAMGRLGFPVNDLDPIAQTGNQTNFLAAGKDAPFTTFAEFCEYGAAHPKEISAAVQIGALSHFHVISAANSCDVELNYVNASGGGAAFRAGLLGGNIDIAPLIAAEAAGLGKSGDVNVLAFLGDDRHPLLPDVQTPVEMGFKSADGEINNFWWVRKDVPDDVKKRLETALEAAFNKVNEEGKLAELSMADPKFLDGEGAKEVVVEKSAKIQQMVEQAGLAAK